jgi:hypothetical protein
MTKRSFGIPSSSSFSNWDRGEVVKRGNQEKGKITQSGERQLLGGNDEIQCEAKATTESQRIQE